MEQQNVAFASGDKDPMPGIEGRRFFIGVKLIAAEPQVKDGQDGYQVTYADGYVSWSPKDVFERAYRPTHGLTFGLAIEALKMGRRVARSGWNGKGMWLSLSGPERKIGAEQFWSKNNADYAAQQDDGQAVVLPCITMKTATGEILMGWLASQTDMLAEDWNLVEGN